ncbi:TetR/AcrR family transcriptional regulator [Chengkuizengella axinellae]|uniref:TetR/AcrR family transcriptional regulator C-terminal domain-containing protein n=1 Tax=Chengkuizengella axinellae TaxID=3064388 RepID=A0ABT9J330_9BACL|nr:TetR/AcrR family transcriptional regulator [Chengkuizengella sp. 2205SS18-9]MDP5275878.1 TetR/AcrR family transcriptional regulator C-terminal domain-containing protein [Chengkuizengella sp. 2205SS18-9]
MDPRVKRTKKALREALLILLEHKLYHSITITDIMRTAEFNRATFYAHYMDKDDLLTDVIENAMNELLDSLRNPFAHSNETIDLQQLTPIKIGLFEHIYRNIDFYRLMLGDPKIPEFTERMFEVVKQFYASEISVVLEGDEDSKDQVINKDLYHHYYASSILGMIIFWVNNNFQYTPEYMTEQLLLIIKHKVNRVTHFGKRDL